MTENLELNKIAGSIIAPKKRRKSYSLDLRIKSPGSLSYFGIDNIETAPALIRLAKQKKIDVIAITDYYSVDSVDKVCDASLNTPISVLPGVVIKASIKQTNDTVLTCLFNEETRSHEIQSFLDDLGVPSFAKNNPNFVIDKDLDFILEKIEKHKALAIPSRMDLKPDRLKALEILVEDYGFRAFDLAYYPESLDIFKTKWAKTKFQLFTFSNAGALAQVGNRSSTVLMKKPGYKGLKDIIKRK